MNGAERGRPAHRVGAREQRRRQPVLLGRSLCQLPHLRGSPTRVRSAYRDRTYSRLQQVKTAYDPGNLLRGTLNIPTEHCNFWRLGAERRHRAIGFGYPDRLRRYLSPEAEPAMA